MASQMLAGIVLLVAVVVAAIAIAILSPGLLINWMMGRFAGNPDGFLLASAKDWPTWLVSVLTWSCLFFLGYKLFSDNKGKKGRPKPSEHNSAIKLSAFNFGPFPGSEAVSEYVAKYRRADLPKFEVSPAMDLFPLRPLPAGFLPELTWKDSWPFGDRTGVYLLYGEAFDLIYIGKVSMNRCLGNRLYEYFGAGDECVTKGDWLRPVRYVITIGFPPEITFEVPALEEFLIRKLQPRCNVAGK